MEGQLFRGPEVPLSQAPGRCSEGWAEGSKQGEGGERWRCRKNSHKGGEFSPVLVSGLGAPVTEATSSPPSPASSSAEEDAGSQSSSRLKVTSRVTPYSALAG